MFVCRLKGVVLAALAGSAAAFVTPQVSIHRIRRSLCQGRALSGPAPAVLTFGPIKVLEGCSVDRETSALYSASLQSVCEYSFGLRFSDFAAED